MSLSHNGNYSNQYYWVHQVGQCTVRRLRGIQNGMTRTSLLVSTVTMVTGTTQFSNPESHDMETHPGRPHVAVYYL